MSELATNNLIKIILGILLIAAVAFGVYLVFKNQVFDFFRGLSVGNATKLWQILLR